MGASKIIRYRDVDVPRQPGEVGRIRVLKGPNQGMIYVVKNSSITLGRGEEADVMLSDLKSSRKHAKIEFTNQGWVVTDLGSSNGILFQGEYLRKFKITSGHHFTIGDTILEFLESSEQTRVLVAPLRLASEVAQLDQALINQRLKVQQFSKPVQIQAVAKEKKKNPVLLIVVALAAAYMYQDDIMQMLGMQDQKVAHGKKSKKDKEGQASEITTLLPPDAMSPEVVKTSEQYYRQGFREYREGNYLRAKSQFELALQVNPNHQLARKNLANVEHEIDNEVKVMKESAEKARVTGRLREAKGYYETAMRLLYFDRSNPDYVECEEAVKAITVELSKGANP